MDEKPFFEFNVTDIKDNQIEELKKFHKSYFDVGSIQNTASELKYMNELKSADKCGVFIILLMVLYVILQNRSIMAF